MRSSRKISTVALALALALLSGCNLEDFVPESYGEWEGYYIYAGNGRSKTTGENFQTLVSELETGGFTYEVQRCSDYAFLDDNIYLCLRAVRSIASDSSASPMEKGEALPDTSEDPRPTLEWLSAVVSYDMQTKETKVLHSEVGPYDLYIVKALAERLLFTNGHGWRSVNYEGEALDEDFTELNSYTSVEEEYLFKDTDEGYFYRTWEDGNAVKICDASCSNVVYSEEGEGFFVFDSKGEQLSFYDIASGETVLLGTSERFYLFTDIAQGDYFMTFTPRVVTYKYRTGSYNLNVKTGSGTEYDNCVLYKVVYDGANTTAEKVFEFEEGRSFTNVSAIADGKLFVRSSWYQDAKGCDGGGEKFAYCRVDLATGTVDEIDVEKWNDELAVCKDSVLKENGLTVGAYTYFIRRDEMYTWLGDPSVYLLNRYDGEKTEVLQLFTGGDREEEKYCKEMWDPVLPLIEEGDSPRFAVRAY